MEDELELRMYFFVPYNISDIQKAIQAGHSALEYAKSYGNTKLFKDFVSNHKTWIILNGGTTNSNFHKAGNRVGTLNQIVESLESNMINNSIFIEPDLNDAITSVCFVCDERVWNYEKYPNIGKYILYIKMYKEARNSLSNEISNMLLNSDDEVIMENFPKWYEEWIEFMGGKKNVFLRELIKNKKLA